MKTPANYESDRSEMDELPTETGKFGDLDVAVVQASRHSRSFVRSMLAGIKVGNARTYGDAEHALEEMRQAPPSLVITDWETTGRSGFWLVTNMRRPESGGLRLVPALALTPEVSPPMLDVALGAGVSSVLIKPLSAANLRRHIEALMQPQSFVEHEGAFIPESARDTLENRLRAGETAEHREHRLQLRETLEQRSREAVEQDSPTEATAEQDAPAGVGWKGWKAA